MPENRNLQEALRMRPHAHGSLAVFFERYLGAMTAVRVHKLLFDWDVATIGRVGVNCEELAGFQVQIRLMRWIITQLVVGLEVYEPFFDIAQRYFQTSLARVLRYRASIFRI